MAKETVSGIMRFKSAYSGFTGYTVNVYGTVIGSGKNVCLYDDDPDDTLQQFIPQAQGNNVYKLASKDNAKIVLDHYRVTPVNNCDVYTSGASTSAGALTNDLKDQQVYLEKTGSYYYIVLYNGNGTKSYLTCASTANGDGCGSPTTNTVNVKNNIYWASLSSSLGNRQKWSMVKMSPTALDTVLPHSQLYCQRDNTWAYLTTAGEFDSLACGVCSAAMVTAIMEADDSITPLTMRNRGVFSYGDVTTNWPKMSSEFSMTTECKDNLTSALSRIYEEITAGRPVVVRVQKPTYKHFVVANGLKSGTTPSNISTSRVLIMDPYTPSYTKLSELLSGSTFLFIDTFA